jgi:signal transduction histidine kinase
MKDIRKLHDLISESLSLAKKLLKGLFLVEIDYEGLPSTLKNLATSVSEIYEITCTFEEENEENDIDVIKQQNFIILRMKLYIML